MEYSQHCYITRPNRFCSKICHVGGRLIAVELWCDRPRRSLDFDSLRGAPPLHGVYHRITERKFRCAVGADSIRPVVSPLGKQRRRKAPTMQCQTFANEIRWYHVETWYILQHRNPDTANSVLLKNLQRWRAADSRPYADGATESAGQKFGGTTPTWRIL